MYKIQINIGLCRGYRGENWADTATSLILSFPLSLSVTCPRRVFLVFKTGEGLGF